MTAIEETKDIKTLSLEDLIGLLLTHEMVLKDEEDKNPQKTVALQVADKKEKEQPLEEDDEEFALITRKFKMFLKNHCNAKKEESREEELLRCFNCNKVGHLASNCQVKPSQNKKALAVTWDDNEN